MGGSHETAKLRPGRLQGIEEELLCGKLTVFGNRLSRSGRTIDLNVVVLPALDPKNKEEPLFDLAGGPGGASTAGASFYGGPTWVRFIFSLFSSGLLCLRRAKF
jgi:hypothetical protein